MESILRGQVVVIWVGDRISLKSSVFSRAVGFSSVRFRSSHDGKGLAVFEGRIERFLETREGRRLADVRLEKALYSPLSAADEKICLIEKGYHSVDMIDLETWLTV